MRAPPTLGVGSNAATHSAGSTGRGQYSLQYGEGRYAGRHWYTAGLGLIRPPSSAFVTFPFFNKQHPANTVIRKNEKRGEMRRSLGLNESKKRRKYSLPEGVWKNGMEQNERELKTFTK